MVAGILAVESVSRQSVACIGSEESVAGQGSAELGVFVAEDGSFRRLTWSAFHRDLRVVGFDEALGAYAFIGQLAAERDLRDGRFIVALLAAAMAGSRQQSGDDHL